MLGAVSGVECHSPDLISRLSYACPLLEEIRIAVQPVCLLEPREGAGRSRRTKLWVRRPSPNTSARPATISSGTDM